MLWVDYAILAIIGVSALVSIWRGLVREVLSLLAWVAAFWVALSFTPGLAANLEALVSVPSARLAIAFIALFVGTLLAGAVVNLLIARLVRLSGLSATDRILGVLFGVARGAIIVGAMVLVAKLTPLPKDPWWRESVLLGHFEALALWMRSYIPPDMAEYLGP
jgi:membrane protein required for colicin V production